MKTGMTAFILCFACASPAFAHTAGNIVEYPLVPPAALVFLTSGPDGNVWFTLNRGQGDRPGSSGVGKITPSGAITVYEVAPDAPGAYGLCAGPDGALWFAETYASRIGRITPDGRIRINHGA